jgi:hypothetical protein
MIHYVQKLPPVSCIDLEGNPTGEQFSFAKAASCAISAVMASQGCDALSLIDVRRRILEAPELSYVPVEDEPYNAIAAEFRRPRAMGPAYVLAAEAHIKAWVDAPTREPAHVAANGAASADATS